MLGTKRVRASASRCFLSQSVPVDLLHTLHVCSIVASTKAPICTSGMGQIIETGFVISFDALSPSVSVFHGREGVIFNNN